MRQQVVEGLDLGFGRARREERAGALDEVVLVAACSAEGFHISLDAALADVAVGIEADFKGDDFDFKSFLGEEADGFFGGVGSGGVGVEVDDDALAVATEEAGLHLGEGGAAGGEDVGDAGEVGGDAVHLAFDEDGEVGFADGLAGLVEIEKDLALGVERGFGRVDVFGPGFVAGFDGAGGEGDDAAGLVGDGEGDALAEAGVDGTGGAVFLLFP